MSACPFCRDNWDALNITERYGPDIAILVPLNPVVPGHRLVISDFHSTDAADNPQIAAQLMYSAAVYVRRNKIQANIITSIGEAATQTVLHAHLHVVPRCTDDGLALPWTGQQI
jgi:diadenosine tetraphosphate (Ap4A) HIT family hydrolase